MNVHHCFVLISVLALSLPLIADVKGGSNILFDCNNDGRAELVLDATGLSIGSSVPSTNLMVQGNAVISGRLGIGTSSPSSNLEITGTLGMGVATFSDNTVITNQASIILADTTSGNITLTLPRSNSCLGRVYTIKKTSPSNDLRIIDEAGSFIDGQESLVLGGLVNSTLPYINLLSGNQQWYVLNQPAGSNFTDPQATGTLLAYDDFNVADTSLDDLNSGVGWNGIWSVQNNELLGFLVKSASPLTYPGLSSNAPYAEGGESFQSSGRNLDATTTFAEYSSDGTRLMMAGKSIWVSWLWGVLDAGQSQTFVLSDSGTTWSTSNPEAARIDNNSGFWRMGINDRSVEQTSTVPVTVSTYLFVLNISWAEAGTGVATLYINPDNVGTGFPSSPYDIRLETSSSGLQFRGIRFKPGNDVGDGAIDELRFGTTYRSVTP